MARLADDQSAAPQRTPEGPGQVRLDLLNGFSVSLHRRTVAVAPSAQRLVSYLALQDYPVQRQQIVAALWPDEAGDQGWSHLRASLWRLRHTRVPIIEVIGTQVGILDSIVVDVRQVVETCRHILSGQQYDRQLVDQLLHSREPFPSLDEEWATAARALIQELRLHALERLCEDATEHGDFGRAIEAGLAAVTDDPLRESAHRALIKLYLAEGNRSQALRQFDTYRKLMRAELGLPPAKAIRKLMSGIRAT